MGTKTLECLPSAVGEIGLPGFGCAGEMWFGIPGATGLPPSGWMRSRGSEDPLCQAPSPGHCFRNLPWQGLNKRGTALAYTVAVCLWGVCSNATPTCIATMVDAAVAYIACTVAGCLRVACGLQKILHPAVRPAAQVDAALAYTVTGWMFVVLRLLSGLV